MCNESKPKRQKRCAYDGNEGRDTADWSLLLDKYIRAKILGYCDFQTVRAFICSSSVLRTAVVPSISVLRVEFGDSLDLDPNYIASFESVRCVFVYLHRVVHDNGTFNPTNEIDYTLLSSIPEFTTHLPALSRCYVGLKGQQDRASCQLCCLDLGRCHCINEGVDTSGLAIYNDGYSDQERYARWNDVICTICEKYQSGTLPHHVQFDGILPRQRGHWNGCIWRRSPVTEHSKCVTCNMLCKSFPIEQVLGWYHVSLPCMSFPTIARIAKWRDPTKYSENVSRCILNEIEGLGYVVMESAAHVGGECRVLDLYPVHTRTWRVGSIVSKIRVFMKCGISPQTVVDCLLVEKRQQYYHQGKRSLTPESFESLKRVLGADIIGRYCCPLPEEPTSRAVTRTRVMIGESWRAKPTTMVSC